MNLPNVLTVIRIILTFVFIVLFYQEGMMSKVYALIVFTVASLTDYFDGYYARKYDLITFFGKIMDPIADKFLVLSAFFIAMQMHIIALWMFLVIFIREVVVTGLRLFAVQSGKALAAEKAGKVKTVLQIVAVYLIIILTILAQVDTDIQWCRTLVSWLANGTYVLMWGVVLITLWSGLSFLKNNYKKIFYVR